nr:aquaporin [Mycoplasmopsis felis]
MLLVGLVLAFSKGSNVSSLATFGPIPVTLIVIAIGASLGSSTGYAINPARIFGPRVIYYLTERLLMKNRKQEFVGGNWSYSWIPVLAPLTGGLLIGLFSLI